MEDEIPLLRDAERLERLGAAIPMMLFELIELASKQDVDGAEGVAKVISGNIELLIDAAIAEAEKSDRSSL